jgi:DNA-binding GntR family transcriptional regulator
MPGDQRRGESVEWVIASLRQGILEGRYVAGQRLIAREVTEDLGISRSTVREAFRRLAADGMLELVPNRGAAVRHLSRREVRDLFQVRENLEGLAAGLAAAQIGQGDNRRTFRAVWDEVRPTGRELAWNSFIRHNRLYHQTIVAISGNDLLFRLIDNLQLPVMMFQIGRAMAPENAAVSHHDHVLVAEAILAGDAKTAERAMRTHLRRSFDWVSRLPDRAFRRDPTAGGEGLRFRPES